jgi:hypothetical protein
MNQHHSGTTNISMLSLLPYRLLQKRKSFGDPSLTIEDKKGFLQGVVDRIDVKSLDNQTHELKVGFTFPYVGDTLVKDTQNGKSPKSRVKGGKKVKRVRTNLLKKPTG